MRHEIGDALEHAARLEDEGGEGDFGEIHAHSGARWTDLAETCVGPNEHAEKRSGSARDPSEGGGGRDYRPS